MRPKRRFGEVPIVEKLYKKNQENYTSAGGFDAGDDEVQERRTKFAELAQQKRDREAAETSTKPDECTVCNKMLLDAHLWNTFSYPVCDSCSKEDSERYTTVSRTRAKTEYLLKDEDLDLRRPILRYVSRKNPHNPRYGDMKLYLELQVIERAIQLHGSLAQLEVTKELRQEKKEEMTAKKYEKKIKKMQKETRSNNPVVEAIHEHQYGEEKHKNGVYWQECTACGFVNEYEKL